MEVDMRLLSFSLCLVFSFLPLSVLGNQSDQDQLKMEREEDAYDGKGEKKFEEEWNYNEDTDELQDPVLDEGNRQKQEEKRKEEDQNVESD
jgi:hypothetical protein